MSTTLEMASDSEGALRSELIRRALKYYIQENPDDIQVFDQGKLVRSPRAWSASQWPNAANDSMNDT